MAVTMPLAGQSNTMGEHVIGRRLRWLGWTATGAVAATVAALLLTRQRLRAKPRDAVAERHHHAATTRDHAAA